jgi:hypothetical protein
VIVSFTGAKPGSEQKFPDLSGLTGFSAVARASPSQYIALAAAAGSDKTDVVFGTAV